MNDTIDEISRCQQGQEEAKVKNDMTSKTKSQGQKEDRLTNDWLDGDSKVRRKPK